MKADDKEFRRSLTVLAQETERYECKKATRRPKQEEVLELLPDELKEKAVSLLGLTTEQGFLHLVAALRFYESPLDALRMIDKLARSEAISTDEARAFHLTSSQLSTGRQTASEEDVSKWSLLVPSMVESLLSPPRGHFPKRLDSKGELTSRQRHKKR